MLNERRILINWSVRMDARSLSRISESNCIARFIIEWTLIAWNWIPVMVNNYIPMSRQVSLEIVKVMRMFSITSFNVFSLRYIYSFRLASCTIAICLHTSNPSLTSDMELWREGTGFPCQRQWRNWQWLSKLGLRMETIKSDDMYCDLMIYPLQCATCCTGWFLKRWQLSWSLQMINSNEAITIRLVTSIWWQHHPRISSILHLLFLWKRWTCQRGQSLRDWNAMWHPSNKNDIRRQRIWSEPLDGILSYDQSEINLQPFKHANIYSSETSVYTIYKFDTKDASQWHQRVKIMSLFYIEGASLLDDNDPKWNHICPLWTDALQTSPLP